VAKIQMEVIPKPAKDTAAVIRLTSPNFILKDPYLIMRGSGKGSTDYVCGCCRVTLVSSFNRGQIVNIVFECANCGSYNIVRGT